MLSSYTCGVHVAGMMVLGLLIGRENIQEGLDGVFPIAAPGQDLIRRLNAKIGSHSCRELTGVDFTDLNQALAFQASQAHAVITSYSIHYTKLYEYSKAPPW